MRSRRLPRYRRVVAAFGGLAAGLAFATSSPASQDFPVNVTTEGDQDYQDVATDEAGGSLIVWTSDGAGFGADHVFARRFDADGSALTGEIEVNPGEGQWQISAHVCRRAGGGWVVIWHNFADNDYHGSGSEDEGVFARFLDDGGTPLAPAFAVSTTAIGSQGLNNDVACLPDGGFVAAWGSADQDGSYYGVRGQRIDVDGANVGDEFQVNTETEGDQGNFGEVTVESGPEGEVLVVWSSNCPAYASSEACPAEPDGSASSVQARLFNPDGVPLGDEFRVNTTTEGSQGSDGIAASFDASGDFLVVWYDGDRSYADCNNWAPCGDVYGQRFATGGVPVGSEFVVNAYTHGLQLHPTVAMDGNGGFLVVWQHAGIVEVDEDAIVARHFDSSGSALGSDFLVTNNLPLDDRTPRVAAADGKYVVTWTGFNNSFGPSRDVVARVLGSELPVCPPIPDEDCDEGGESQVDLRSGSGELSLKWKWRSSGEVADLGPLGGMNGYAICLYDALQLVSSASIAPYAQCGGEPCWRGRNGRYGFKNPAGSKFALRKIKLRTGASPRSASLSAKGIGSPSMALDAVSAPLVAELLTSDGSCWRATYDQVERGSARVRARNR